MSKEKKFIWNIRDGAVRLGLFLLAAFFAGLFFGWYGKKLLPEGVLRKFFSSSSSSFREGGYTYINPLLFCTPSENKEFTEFLPLKEKVQEQVRKNGVGKIALYFRDLNAGRWFGINENEKFAPASLLKVPTMIAFLKLAESNPSIMTKQVAYQGDFDDNRAEIIKPLKRIEAGKTYTIQDLLAYMIEFSDNNATRLLHENIDQRLLFEVYTDLGVSLPVSPAGVVDYMSPKTYSYFFRVLYNSTYLTRQMSEFALKLLAAPDFPEGLQAGVPAGVEVAQKFGERMVFDQSGVLIVAELHDCGIVYYPNHPYLLCVMTNGKNMSDLSAAIRDISATIYGAVDADNKTK